MGSSSALCPSSGLWYLSLWNFPSDPITWSLERFQMQIFQSSKVPPDDYVLPSSTEEGPEKWWMAMTTKVSAVENKLRKKRCYWKERCIPDPTIYMTFLLILSWWCLWSESYKHGLISQHTALEYRPWLSLGITAPLSSPKIFLLWVWHHPDALVSPASCPFLTHSTYALQSTCRETYKKLIFTTKMEKRCRHWRLLGLQEILVCKSPNSGGTQWWDGFGVGL